MVNETRAGGSGERTARAEEDLWLFPARRTAGRPRSGARCSTDEREFDGFVPSWSGPPGGRNRPASQGRGRRTSRSPKVPSLKLHSANPKKIAVGASAFVCRVEFTTKFFKPASRSFRVHSHAFSCKRVAHVFTRISRDFDAHRGGFALRATKLRARLWKFARTGKEFTRTGKGYPRTGGEFTRGARN